MFDEQIRRIVANHLLHLSIEHEWPIEGNNAISILYQAFLDFKFRLTNYSDVMEIGIKPPELICPKRAPRIVVGYDEILQGGDTNKNRAYNLGCPKAIYSTIDSVILALAQKIKDERRGDALLKLDGQLVLRFDDLLLDELCYKQERLLEGEIPEKRKGSICEELLRTKNFRALNYIDSTKVSKGDIEDIRRFLEFYTAILVKRKGRAVELNRKALEGVINEELVRSKVAVAA